MRNLCCKAERVLVSQVCPADCPLTPTFFIKPVYFKPEAMCYLSRKSMLSLFFFGIVIARSFCPAMLESGDILRALLSCAGREYNKYVDRECCGFGR